MKNRQGNEINILQITISGHFCGFIRKTNFPDTTEKYAAKQRKYTKVIWGVDRAPSLDMHGLQRDAGAAGQHQPNGTEAGALLSVCYIVVIKISFANLFRSRWGRNLTTSKLQCFWYPFKAMSLNYGGLWRNNRPDSDLSQKVGVRFCRTNRLDKFLNQWWSKRYPPQ